VSKLYQAKGGTFFETQCSIASCNDVYKTIQMAFVIVVERGDDPRWLRDSDLSRAMQ